MLPVKHPVRADAERLKEAASLPPAEASPFYDVMDNGLYYVGVKVDKDHGKPVHTRPLRLCDALEIIGRGIDHEGGHYRVLRWRSRGDNREQIAVMAAASIGERDSWAMLRRGGMAVSTGRGAQEKLADYLQLQGSEKLYHVTKMGGWNHGAYVLPSGEIIGQPKCPLFYHGDTSHARAYAASGTAQDWRDGVARLARGNSRPMLAIGCAFAAPLLRLVDMESGGFHLYGDSGDGKTTTAKAGASVWGHPQEQTLNWDGTAYALSNAAAARNDGLMLLDEVGQGSVEAVSKAAYRLFNGTSKMQGEKDGGNRDMLRWRVLALSTGEEPLYEFLSAGGRRVKAGQEVRLPSIPANAGAGYGAFELLHEHSTAGQLAEALEAAALRHHGAAGRDFVAAIAANLPALSQRLKTAVNAWRDSLPPEASGQARRVTARFAIVAEALEIATEQGLTGWDVGEGTHAVRRCHAAWLHRYGIGKREDEQLVEQAAAFFATHGFARFIDLLASQGPDEPHMPHCAGYRKRDRDGGLYFLVHPHVFAEEVANGFDKVKAAEVLHRAGMLTRGQDGKWQGKHRTPDYPSPRRFYRFDHITPADDDQSERDTGPPA